MEFIENAISIPPLPSIGEAELLDPEEADSSKKIFKPRKDGVLSELLGEDLLKNLKIKCQTEAEYAIFNEIDSQLSSDENLFLQALQKKTKDENSRQSAETLLHLVALRILLNV